MPQVDLKIVLLGDMAVGKTCLSERFANDRFTESISFQNTIGTAFVARHIEVDDKKLMLGIWDTAGCERYDAMTKLYYRGAQAAIICYDITNQKSFAKAKYWVREVRSVEETCKIYICATKKDLLEQGRQATPDIDLVENYATGVGAKFYITSSKTGENVVRPIEHILSLRAAELFQDIASFYAPTIDKNNQRQSNKDGFISLSTDNKGSSCCSMVRRN